MTKIYSNVIGFDDAPFSRTHRGDVPVVGAVFAGERFDGLLTGKIRRDGANSARTIAGLVRESRFYEHAQLIMTQGIAFGGFNVIDIRELHKMLGLPVLVVARRRPDMDAVKEALLNRVRGGRRKWKIIERIGAMEPAGAVFVQRAGLDSDEAEAVVERFAFHGNIPEPLRVAHIIAGGMARGESRGRV